MWRGFFCMKECRSLSAPHPPRSIPPHSPVAPHPLPPSPPLLTHMSAIWPPCVFWMLKKKKEHFKVNEKKESLIRLAVALRSKLLSADVLQLKLAWVMSSDALQY